MGTVRLLVTMRMCLLFYLLTTSVLSFSDAQSTTVINGRTCTVMPPTSISLAAGWPFPIPCFPVFQLSLHNFTHPNGALDWCDFTEQDDTFLQCLAINISSGATVFNASTSCFSEDELVIQLDDVYPTGQPSLRLVIVADTVPSGLEVGLCEVHEYTFLSNAEPSTCRESADAFSGDDTDVTAGQTITLTCPHDEQVNTTLASFGWLYKCESLNGTRFSELGPRLRVENFGYEDAGIYTCVATYNGRRRYFPVRTCVHPTYAASAPTITCERKEAEVDIGGNATLTCTVSFGPGIVMMRLFTLFWKKDGLAICVNGRENKTEYNDDMSIGCNYTLVDPFSGSCIRNYSGEHALVTAKLALSNVEKDDLGDHVITVVTLQNLTGSETIRLIERPKPPPVELIAGLTVGISLFIIIVFILLYVFRFYVKVYWKRWFGTYEKDIFRHEAYVSYHASQGLDQGAINMVRDARTTTIKELRSLGFQRLYDQYESFEPGMLAEVVMNAINESHRVVIILSYEYIQASEAVFNLQQAVMKNIATGKKIIFILLPGTREAVAQRVNEDNGRYRMIKRMMETCHTIQWSTGSDFDGKRFRFKLEYAMPKLRRPNTFTANSNGVYENGHTLPPMNGTSRTGGDAGEAENQV